MEDDGTGKKEGRKRAKHESAAEFGDTQRVASGSNASSALARTREGKSKSKAQADGPFSPRRIAPRKPAASAEDDNQDSKESSHLQRRNDDPPREFQTISSSAPRSLHEVVQAPPEFHKLPRGARRSRDSSDAARGVLSMAQKTMMEKEREDAIARYRALKQKRRSWAEAKVTSDERVLPG